MKKGLRILAPCHKDFFLSHAKSYTGAQHFTSNLLVYFENTLHTLIGVAFDTPLKERGISTECVYKGETPWLMVRMLLPTLDILKIPIGEEDEKTREIINHLAEAFLALKPDLFFLNGLSAITYILMRAAVKAGIPIVTTHHGLWFWEASVHPGISKMGIELRKKIERETVIFSEKNIFLSPLSLRFFEKHVGAIPPHQAVVITLPYNPLFCEQKKRPTHLKKESFRVGLIGRWDPVKNHHAYLALAKEAKRQELDWEFVAATSMSHSTAALEDIYEEYTECIETYPHMQPEELKTFYEALDIVLVPSHVETFCGVVMEAILQGKPVLISPGVGWVDAFEEYGLAHWITSFEDPARVIEKIKHIVHEVPPQKLVDDVLHDNHPEVVFAQYEKLFQEVVRDFDQAS